MRFIQNLIIVSYLVITASAFIFTMSLWMPPLPEPVVYTSYAMMAPYQQDNEWNADLLAEGQLPDGTWEPISLARYFPYGQGEEVARKHVKGFMIFGTDRKIAEYKRFAEQLLALEQKRGKPYTSVRMHVEVWSRSPGGYEHLHTPELTQKFFPILVP